MYVNSALQTSLHCIRLFGRFVSTTRWWFILPFVSFRVVLFNAIAECIILQQQDGWMQSRRRLSSFKWWITKGEIYSTLPNEERGYANGVLETVDVACHRIGWILRVFMVWGQGICIDLRWCWAFEIVKHLQNMYELSKVESDKMLMDQEWLCEFLYVCFFYL